MDKWIALSRRAWVAAIPLLIFAGQLFGLDLTEQVLTDTADKVIAGVMAALALWSIVRPDSGGTRIKLAP